MKDLLRNLRLLLKKEGIKRDKEFQKLSDNEQKNNEETMKNSG